MSSQSSSDLRVINARVFRVYMELCRAKLNWSEADVDEFLQSLGTSWARLREDASWYTLNFTDQFYEALRERTGIENLAFQAGAFIYEKDFSPAIHYLARGLMRVGSLYRLLARFTTYFTRASVWEVEETGRGHALLSSRPIIEAGDRPYICENRQGILSALPRVFGLEGASVVEVECFHKGGSRCRYEVEWSEIQSKESVFFSLLVGSIGGLILALSFSSWWLAIVGLAVGAFFGFIRFALADRKERLDALLNQNQILDDSLKRLERKSTELDLISQITNLVLRSESLRELGAAVVENVCVLLHYDRALLLLVDPERAVLKVEAFHGFEPQLEKLLSETEFNIRPDNSLGFFIRVALTGKPLLVSDVSAEMNNLSARSRKFAEILNAKSFVAVPILDKTERVLGVLAVDYTCDSKAMTLQDQDLLMTLGQNIGLTLRTAQLVDDLKRNLDRANQLTENEARLKSIFQKYVPDALASEMTMNSDIGRLVGMARKERAAVLFFDIANFSGWAEKREAEEVVEFVNRMLSVIVPEIGSFGGVVDKFLGDGLIAVFRGPSAAERSGYSALRILRRLSNELGLEGAVGLAYGAIVLGNIGTPDRLNYTVMGETVNLASRLQGVARTLGQNRVCVSEGWVRECNSLEGAGMQVSAGERVSIRGYSESVLTFELSAISDGTSVKGNHQDGGGIH